MLEDIDVIYDYLPDISRAEIIEKIADYDGLIIRSKTKVDAELLANATKLKFVGRPGAGIDNMDEELLSNMGVAILNAPEGNRDAVAEHTIGLTLSVLNNIHTGHNEVLTKIWDREGNRGEEIADKTFAIIGYGNMGQALAKRLSGFNCTVLAYDKYRHNYGDKYAEQTSLEQIFKQADIVSLHIPLIKQNFRWANIEFFNKFKNNIIFINTARGEIAPLGDLVKAVESGKIRKAGLDVLENENFTKLNSEQISNLEKLQQSGKVLFTPHVAGWSSESYIKLNQYMIEKIQLLLAKNISN